MRLQYPEIRTVCQISEHHALHYRHHLEEENISNSTRNDHLASLKMVFKYMEKSGHILSSPFSGIKKFAASKVRREIFSMEELELIFSKADGLYYQNSQKKGGKRGKDQDTHERRALQCASFVLSVVHLSLPLSGTPENL